MSRPKDLPAGLQNWANANYSPGPAWGGTAQRQAPVGTTLTPGVSAPAENANYLWGYGFDAAQGAINAGGQLPALNWGSPTTPGSTLVNVVYSEFEAAWYGVLPGAGATVVYRSSDQGKTWATMAIAVNTTMTDMGFDAAGNGVICGGSNIQSGAITAYGAITWTNNLAVVPVLAAAQVVYETVSGKWCVVGDLTATGKRVSTSSNRTAWAASTIPASWSGATVAAFPQVGVGNGLVVATFIETGGASFRVMRSADGGVTWTNDQSIALNGSIVLALNAASMARPVWSPTDALWYVVANMLSPRRTQVFSSPDAITWSTAATFLANDIALRGIVALGSLLIGTQDDGRLFSSINKGVTWFKLGQCGVATPTVMRGGGGGWAILGSTTVVNSNRFGLPTVSV